MFHQLNSAMTVTVIIFLVSAIAGSASNEETKIATPLLIKRSLSSLHAMRIDFFIYEGMVNPIFKKTDAVRNANFSESARISGQRWKVPQGTRILRSKVYCVILHKKYTPP